VTLLLSLLLLVQDIPRNEDHLTDVPKALSDEQRASLESLLTSYQQQSTNEIAVLIVRSTAPYEIRQYGIKVADAWKVGKRGKDNGVLFVVALDDRTMSIEVGRGLEGDLTDLQSSYIIREVAEFFKRGQYYDGLNHGVQQVIKALGGHYVPPRHVARPSPTGGGNAMLIILIIIFLFIVFSSRGSPGGCLWFWLGWGMGRGGSGYRWNSGGGGGFGGFGGGTFGGGGASGRW
jgi:uncharacterized protein